MLELLLRLLLSSKTYKCRYTVIKMVQKELYSSSFNPNEFENIDWQLLLSAHDKKSSSIYVAKDNGLLKKVKQRNINTRNDEFYRLSFCENLFKKYNSSFETSFYSPSPICAIDEELIMKYEQGIELDRLLKSKTTSDQDLEKIIFQLGQLFALKENEGIYHGDFDLRHLLINNGISLIDLEKLETKEFEKSRYENEEFENRINEYLGESITEKDIFQKGKSSIPKEFLSRHSLKETVREYSSVAKRAIIGNKGRI